MTHAEAYTHTHIHRSILPYLGILTCILMCETFLCVHVNNCVYVIEVSEYDPLNLYINRRKQSIYLVVNCDGAALISLKH